MEKHRRRLQKIRPELLNIYSREKLIQKEKPLENTQEEKKNPLREIIDPFINLVKAPRALWGINLSYLIEGLTYFGVLGLLAIYFNEYIGLDDVQAGWMVGFLTGGITLAMLFLGGTVDWIGVRKALLIALFFFLIGRIFLSLAALMPTDDYG